MTAAQAAQDGAMDQIFEPYWDKVAAAVGAKKPADDGYRYTNKEEILRATGMPEGAYKDFISWAQDRLQLESAGRWWRVTGVWDTNDAKLLDWRTYEVAGTFNRNPRLKWMIK